MVTTTRDKEVFLLAPGDHSDGPGDYHPLGQGSILVVEDDAPTLRLERVLLEEEGYSVEVVASGEEAIQAVIDKKPALVLLDIGLPGIDGFTTCQRIREISRVPIIMVTGRDCLDDKVKGMNVGADDYVTKPFLTHELATRVKVLLRRSGLENGPLQHSNGSAPGRQHPASLPPESSPNGAAASHRSGAVSGPVSPEKAASPEPDPSGPAPAQPPATSQDGPPQLTTEPPAPGLDPSLAETPPEAATSPEPEPPPAAADNDDLYEGTVRLTVNTLGPVSHLINFVSELRQNPQFRLLRLVANQHKEGMDIWLRLREPLSLKSCLGVIKGVAEVSISPEPPGEGREPVFKVLLN